MTDTQEERVGIDRARNGDVLMVSVGTKGEDGAIIIHNCFEGSDAEYVAQLHEDNKRLASENESLREAFQNIVESDNQFQNTSVEDMDGDSIFQLENQIALIVGMARAALSTIGTEGTENQKLAPSPEVRRQALANLAKSDADLIFPNTQSINKGG